MAILMAVGRMLLMALLGTTQLSATQGYATEFGSSQDMLTGGTMACTGKKMEPDDLVCAHRSLPCGTMVLVHSLRTKKVATCTVVDRGPFGATLPNGEIILKVRASEEGTWRGLIDLSPAVARNLGLSGREQVGLIYERPRRRNMQTARLDARQPVFASRK
jgi:rare lipoprotein A (peptidoglycan hydrolase)